MENLPITSLDELTTPAEGDYVEVVDVSDTTMAATGTNKKVTYSNMWSNVAYARAHTANVQTIPNTTQTKVILEVHDSQRSITFSSDTFLINLTGLYQMNAAIYFDSSVDATIYQVSIFKNGQRISSSTAQSAGTGDIAPSVSDIAYLVSGDYLELYAYQDSGSSKNLTNGSSEVFLSAVLVAK